MDVRDYIRILRKSWILIVAVTLVGIAAAAVTSILMTPKYIASTQLFVSVQSSDSVTPNELVQGSSAAQQKVRSYVDVVRSSRVLDPVIAELDLPDTAEELAERVTASSPLNTVLIDVAVEDTSPQLAADTVNAIGSSFSDLVVNQLEAPSGGGPSLVKIETIEPAIPPVTPASPNIPLNLALGLLIGLIIGAGVALLRYTLDNRIHGSHDVEHVTKSPILGGISFDPGAKKRPLIVHGDPRNPRAESFRSLRTNLQFVNLDSGSRCFVVTSSLPGEGKTTTACNLAIALAETGAKVAIVDGDLRLPRIADTMALEGAAGLTDVLIGRADLEDVLQPWGRGELYVLPAGRVPPNPSELLGSKAMFTVLETLTATFEYVIIDAPPLLPVTDAAILSKLTGGAIVITAVGRTRKNELEAAMRSLEHIGSRVLGVVMTMLPTKGPDAYGYGNYGAYYGMEQDAPEVALAETSQSRVRRG